MLFKLYSLMIVNIIQLEVRKFYHNFICWTSHKEKSRLWHKVVARLLQPVCTVQLALEVVTPNYL